MLLLTKAFNTSNALYVISLQSETVPPCFSLIVEMGIKHLSIYYTLWVQDLVPCPAWLVGYYYPHSKG